MCTHTHTHTHIHTHTHTLATHRERFSITLFGGEKLIKRFKLQKKVEKNHKKYSSQRSGLDARSNLNFSRFVF